MKKRTRSRVFAAALFCSTALWPVQAHAGPLVAAIAGLVSVFSPALATSIWSLTGFSSLGALTVGAQFGAFLTTGLGGLLVSIGVSALQYALSSRPRAPTIDQGSVVVRIGTPSRSIAAGKSVKIGGAVVYAAYDEDDNLWWVTYHCDSELVGRTAYFFDGEQVSVDENGDVTDEQARVGQKESGAAIYRLWTTTHTPNNPIPPGIAELTEALPQWTADRHLLAGCTYTVCRMAALSPQDRASSASYRGPLGLGEPAVSILGEWSRVYDPRNPAHDINDEATWTSTSNLELIHAWLRTHDFGYREPIDRIAWDRVAYWADVCDQPVTDRNGNVTPLYRGGLVIPDEKTRGEAQSEILAACDGQLLHDDEGRVYMMPGHYQAPTLTLSRNRSIFAVASTVADEKNEPLDGVIVSYIEPDHGYQKANAIWLNPARDTTGRAPRYLTYEALACHDYNQAIRLGKAVGDRTVASPRVGLTTNIAALLLSEDRFFTMTHPVLGGDYEVYKNIEVDQSGVVCSVAGVRANPDRWTLLEGEEPQKPPIEEITAIDPDLPDVANLLIVAESVPGSGGAAARFVATFDVPTPVSRIAQIQFKKPDDPSWSNMVTISEDGRGYSDVVSDGQPYQFQSRTLTTSGRAGEWFDYGTVVAAIADPVAPAALASATAVGGMGHIATSFATSASGKPPSQVRIYANQTGTLNRNNDEVAGFSTAPAQSVTHVFGDNTAVNTISDGEFDSPADWAFASRWAVSGGKATKTGGGSGSIATNVTLEAATQYRFGYTVSGRTAGDVIFGLDGGSGTVNIPDNLSNGFAFGTITTGAIPQNSARFFGDAAYNASLDNFTLFKPSATSIAAGIWHVWIEPANGSGVTGPLVGPITINVS